MGSKCDPLPSSSNTWIRRYKNIDFRFNNTPDFTGSIIWIFENFLGAHWATSSDPSLCSILGFALDLGFALNSRAFCAFDSDFAFNTPRALHALVRASNLIPKCSYLQGQSPPDPYSVSVIKFFLIFSFQSFNMDSYTDVSTPRTKFFN